ncbi:MAG: response regulator, partial [Planctomycetaceae bacterium]
MAKLLIIDDEKSVLFSLEQALSSIGLEIVTAETGKQGLQRFDEHSPDVVLSDIRLPDMSGLDVYTQIRAKDPRVPVILATAYSTTETAIEAMKRGAFEYLLKPFDLLQMREVVQKALEQSQLARVPALFEDEQQESLSGDRIVGRSVAMLDTYKAIGRVASQ